MKVSDITPGLWVAIGSEFTGQQAAREGKSAVPARVVGVGKYRQSHLSRCEPIITEDGHTVRVLVRALDIYATWPEWSERKKALNVSGYGRSGLIPSTAPGMPNGPSLTSRRLKWTQMVLDSRVIHMPWEQFVREAEEHRLVALEDAGYRQRKAVLLIELAGRARKSIKLGDKVYFEGGQNRITGTFSASLSDLVRGDPESKRIVAEIKDIERRLSCRVG